MNPDPTISEGCRILAEFEDDAASLGSAEAEYVPVSPALVFPLADPAGLQAFLDSVALIQVDQGDLEGALRQLGQQEESCRRLEDWNGLATSLANHAYFLAFHLGQPRPALTLIDEAHQLAIRHGLVPLAEEIQPILNHIHRQAGA
jgi:hypothetical protein